KEARKNGLRVPKDHTGSAMNRYPTHGSVMMYRGSEGFGSIFFRNELMCTRTVSAVVLGADRHTRAMICSMNSGLPAFVASSSSSENSVGVKRTSRPPCTTRRRSRSMVSSLKFMVDDAAEV